VIVERLRSTAARTYATLGAARGDEHGQAIVEYALILFLVALVSIAILGTLGETVSSMFSDVVTDF
jgi:Flp pilus assembly pilin Flp